MTGFAKILLSITLLIFSAAANAQIIQGTVRDSLTKEPIAYAAVRLDKTAVGTLTDEKGRFWFRNNQKQHNTLVCSFMGYQTKRMEISLDKPFNQDILIKEEGVQLAELVVNPGGKEKYSKKNNPAVELINRVIENKHKHSVKNQDYYNNREYDRIFFAFNEFDRSKQPFKSMEFLDKYVRKSKIDEKLILPISVRETISSNYYRKDTKDKRRVVEGYKVEGIDQGFNLEGLDEVIKEVFHEVDITDNAISILFKDFISPLSSNSAVSFYKWYILDTVAIDSKPYVNLAFVPFNTRDLGFSGNLYVSTDSTYAVKKVKMTIPIKANINFVEKMYIEQNFEQVDSMLWKPKEHITAIDASVHGAVKVYVEKIINFDDFVFNEPVAPIFENPSPEIYLSDYQKKDADFWIDSRPQDFKEDYKLKDMMDEAMESSKLLRFAVNAANLVSSGYVATNKNEEKNKFDIGTVLTVFSHNGIEGGRFRLTGTTTANFHKNLFLYGYGAYGLKDERFKYMGEVTWAFNDKKYHKDEFPINNLTAVYRNDVNALGQRFIQAERDNILLSLRSSSNLKYTYDKSFGLSYHREYHGGFSFKLDAQTHDESPARGLEFKKKDINNFTYHVDNMKSTELGLNLRFAPNEKFYQQRRSRFVLPSPNFVFSASHTVGLKNVLGGEFSYNKTSLSVTKQFWIAPFGKIYASVDAEKIWGEVPFPLLSSPNVNNSFTIQKGAFYQLEPLEFMGDQQLSWNCTWRMGGWIFNRIPFMKALKFREVVGFRGFLGGLSEKNNPEYNRNLFVFPQGSYAMGSKPYMEYNIGIENILGFFRIDYVRRMNYLDHEGVRKSGIKISADVTF